MMKIRHQAMGLLGSRVASLVLVIGLAFAMGSVASSQAAAQSQIITGPINTARRAAAKANAQTAAMQDVNGVSKPGVMSQPSQPASAPAHHPAPIPVASRPVPAASKPAASKPVASQPAAVAAKPTGPIPSASSKPAAMAKAGAPVKGAAPAPAVASAPPVMGGDSAGSISVTERGVKGEVSLNREVFSYDAGDRRDPFISLMRSGDLRPMLSDLRLTTVLYDATGQNSIAVMRDQSTKDQYRVRVGMTLGRMRVTAIQPKQVVFTIEEVGFSRQEALALGDTTKARTP
jgi:hypothetical protein